MFALAVFAALIKLWSPDFSGPESLASETRTGTDPEAPRISTPTGELDIETREPVTRETATPEQGISFVRHELDIPDERETLVRRPETVEPANEPPVFYRPASGASRDSRPGNRPAESGPVCGDLGNFPRSSSIVFPLPDEYLYSYDDTWGAPRPQGGHEGTDLMTPSGVPEYAITDGTVVPVSGSNKSGWNTLGGYAVMVRADYDIGPIREGDLFYYAHMDEESTLPIGAKVQAGQVVGYAGDTGQGPEITRGLFPSHLHLGWYDASGDRSSLDSGAMNPYPLLEWLKRNGGSVVGGSGAEYCEAPPPAAPAPSTGDGYWKPPVSPGTRPDLDTGSDDPLPSPVVAKSEHAPEIEKKGETPGGEPGARASRQNAKTAEQEPTGSRNPDTPGRTETYPKALKPPDPDKQPSLQRKRSSKESGKTTDARRTEAPSNSAGDKKRTATVTPPEKESKKNDSRKTRRGEKEISDPEKKTSCEIPDSAEDCARDEQDSQPAEEIPSPDEDGFAAESGGAEILDDDAENSTGETTGSEGSVGSENPSTVAVPESVPEEPSSGGRARVSSRS